MATQETGSPHFSLGLCLIAGLALAGCDGMTLPSFGKKQAQEGSETTATDTSMHLVERDVEAPDVFDVTEAALWDGRPSLGGVWVAYPDNKEPERVIIRNTENKKFVIGALFKRERDNPGPKIQLSSDAAAALGILAGKPTTISVTALRRESVPVEADATKVATSADSTKIDAKPVDPIVAASAAIDKVEGKKTDTKETSTPTATVTSVAEKPKPTGGLDKPYIQIGIFSVEANAQNTATSLRTTGIVPIVKAQETKGKKFWRVLVGPANSKSERSGLLKKAQELGFGDAYFVTN